MFDESFRYILPGVPAKTDKDRIEGRDFSKYSAKTIVWLDLSGVGVEGKAQSVLYEIFVDFDPIMVGVDKIMSIVVSYCTIELSIDLSLLKMRELE